MQQRYELPVGLSDHTLDNATAIASVALGACIIEKHFTLDRNGGGPDDTFSLEPKELEFLCDGVKTAWQALGDVNYGRKSSEQGNVKFRRSLYFVKKLHAGDTVTPDAIRSIRPGYGLAPKYYDEVIGKKVNKDIKPGMPCFLGDIEL
jgi:N-acetylneuraminate synthase